MTDRKLSTHRGKSGILDRAEDIRRNWTLNERVKRKGLPPDMPQRLQGYLLGRNERSW
jgi:hypothetical protein